MEKRKKYSDPLDTLQKVLDIWGRGHNAKGFNFPTIATYHILDCIRFELSVCGESVFFQSDVKDILEKCGFKVVPYMVIQYKVTR